MKCRRCGYCCRELVIELTEHDVIREPKLKKYAKLMAGSLGYYGNMLDREYVLPSPCPFLKDNKCTIYPTRPNTCVGFFAGGEQCNGSGKKMGPSQEKGYYEQENVPLLT